MKSADVDVFEYAGSDWVDVVVSAEVECVSATVGERAFAALIFDAARHAGVRLSEEDEGGGTCLECVSCRSRLPCIAGSDGG